MTNCYSIHIVFTAHEMTLVIPPLNKLGLKVEFPLKIKRREILNQNIKIYRQPNHGDFEAK